MAGCDYLERLPGIGLGKSKTFWIKVSNPDLNNVLRKIPVYLKMPSVIVTAEYIASFIRANETFLYQIVFDPISKTEKPLTPYSEELEEAGRKGELTFCGSYSDPDIALELALGNLDIHSLQRKTHFNPDNRGDLDSQQPKYGPRASHPSIWCKVGQEISLNQEFNLSQAKERKIIPQLNVDKKNKVDAGSNKRKLETPSRQENKKVIENISEDKIAELLEIPSTPPVKKLKTDYFSAKLEKEKKIKKLVGDTESGDTNVVMVSKYFSSSTEKVTISKAEDDEEENENTSKQGQRRTADLPSGSWFSDISRPTSHRDKFIYNLDTPSNIIAKPLQDISNSPPENDVKIIETPERVRRRNPFAKNLTSPLTQSPPKLTFEQTSVEHQSPSFEHSSQEQPSPVFPSSQLSLYSMDGDSLTFSQPSIDSQETTVGTYDSQNTTVSNDSVELLEDVTKSSPASKLGLNKFSYGSQQEISSISSNSKPSPSYKLGLSKFSYSGPSAVLTQQKLSCSSGSKNKLGPARVSGLSRSKAPSSLIKSKSIGSLKQPSLLSMFSRQEKKADLGKR